VSSAHSSVHSAGSASPAIAFALPPTPRPFLSPSMSLKHHPLLFPSHCNGHGPHYREPESERVPAPSRARLPPHSLHFPASALPCVCLEALVQAARGCARSFPYL
jgi:hypothetical protein